METRSEMKLSRTLVVCVLGICLLGASAHAELYILGKISSGPAAGLCPDAFTMEVTDWGDDQALFTFTNNCDEDGVVTAIYFRDNEMMAFNSIFEQFKDGVVLAGDDAVFSARDKNAMLPGGHSLGFTPHNTFAVKADPAGPKNGLLSDEYLSLLFDLTGGTSFDDIIAALGQQELGVGIHAQAMPGGVSGSFAIVPEPLTLSLLGIGALLIRNKRRGTAQTG